jgi:hypothetical protein
VLPWSAAEAVLARTRTLPGGGVGFDIGSMAAASAARDGLALDRDSARTIDPMSGHMYVAVSKISKAAVNPYYGREVPDYDKLGLNPDMVYQVFRPPEELEKAAQTFVGKPLTKTHKAMNADDYDHSVVIGSIGSKVFFEHPYLKADLSIWDGEAIAEIEAADRGDEDGSKELSCGYGYTPVMENGSFEGQPFQIRMTAIHGNHTTKVESGRAGPDVLVGDHQLRRNPVIKTKALPSRKALIVQGALSALLAPKLAADSKIDLGLVLGGINRANYKAQKANIAKAVGVAVKGKLAQDEELGDLVETVAELLNNLDTTQSGEADEDDLGMDEDETEEENKAREAKKAEDEATSEAEKKKAEDEAEAKKAEDEAAAEADKDKVSGKAMDAAIAKVRSETRRDTIRELNAISEAKRTVRPIVGDLDGDFESAEAVHKFALDAAIDRGIDIDLTGVPASAYGALVKMASAQITSEPKKPTHQAHDAKSAAAVAEMFPGLARIKTV